MSEPVSDDDAPEARYMVPGLQKGLTLLSAFSRETPAMSLSDLGRAVGVSRSAAFRLVYTLEALGFLQRDSDGRRYRLGAKILNLGFSFLAGSDIVEHARPILQSLRDATGMATQLAVLDGTDIVYVARHDSHRSLTSTVAVGTRLPAHATAMGRVLLMDHTPATLRARFGSAPLSRFTDATPQTVAQLATLLGEDRARGYVLSRSNFEAGVDMLALPVRDEQGAICAAISLVGHAWPTADQAWTNKLIATGRDAAEQISVWLGHRPPSPQQDAA
jgi:DNA-binding IclR family transcriptional regulator